MSIRHRWAGLNLSFHPMSSQLTVQDQAKVRQREIKYGEFMRQQDTGILQYLEVNHGISNPTRRLLKMIARVMSHMLGIELDREDKRRKNLLIGWLNFNFELIRPHIAGVVICDGDGRATGFMAQQLDDYRRANPNGTLSAYLRSPRLPNARRK
jgi:hypothetical protein